MKFKEIICDAFLDMCTYLWHMCHSCCVHPSVHMKWLGNSWTDFDEIYYWTSLQNYVCMFRFQLRLIVDNKHFGWSPTHISMHVSVRSFKIFVLHRKLYEKVKYISCSHYSLSKHMLFLIWIKRVNSPKLIGCAYPL